MRKSKETGKGKVVIGNVAFFWCQIFPMTLAMLRFFVVLLFLLSVVRACSSCKVTSSGQFS
jgi:hypothetical protein